MRQASFERQMILEVVDQAGLGRRQLVEGPHEPPYLSAAGSRCKEAPFVTTAHASNEAAQLQGDQRGDDLMGLHVDPGG